MPAQNLCQDRDKKCNPKIGRFRFLVLAHALVCLLGMATPLQAIADEIQSLVTQRDEKVLKSLKREFDWKMEQVPIGEIAETVSKWCGINVLVDAKALEEVGLESDVVLTFHANRVSAEVALDQLLAPVKLSWIVMDGLLILTTPEVVETHPSTRIYNVRDLLAKSYRSDGRTSYDFESMIELIMGTIQPNTWDTVGGPSSIEVYNNDFDAALVISQTHIAHREIDELFRMLRQLPSEAGRYRPSATEKSSRARTSSASAHRQTILAPAWPPENVSP